MKKLILATLAAASVLSSAALLSPPAQAAVRCWWTGPVEHCVRTHPGWWWRYHGYHHPYWWYRW